MKSKLLLLTPLILQTAIWPATRLIFRFFIGFEIKGLENLNRLNRGVIFVSNHSSELDCILLPASLPFLSKFMPMFYVSRPRNFYIHSGWRKYFYGGIIFKVWGAHPAVSGNHDYEISLRTHLDILHNGKSLLIFPEGRKTRTGDVQVNDARGGAAYLSEMTGLPIVPVFMKGLYKMSLGDFLFRRREVIITYSKPVYPAEFITGYFDSKILGDNRYKAATREILRIISNLDGSKNSAISLNIFPKEGSSVLKN